ncbi:hypothetical protein KKG24_00590, partial [Patescibacteria group bacterium]|nr:hypothetical protein [Patescibacteria group bacterium]
SMLEENNIKTLKDALSCEVLWNISVGVTLCRNCHKKTNTYGWNRYNEILKTEQRFKLSKTVALK